MIGALRGCVLDRLGASAVLVELPGVAYRGTVPASSYRKRQEPRSDGSGAHVTRDQIQRQSLGLTLFRGVPAKTERPPNHEAGPADGE
mgnify:CR=1 FL=1